MYYLRACSELDCYDCWWTAGCWELFFCKTSLCSTPSWLQVAFGKAFRSVVRSFKCLGPRDPTSLSREFLQSDGAELSQGLQLKGHKLLCRKSEWALQGLHAKAGLRVTSKRRQRNRLCRLSRGSAVTKPPIFLELESLELGCIPKQDNSTVPCRLHRTIEPQSELVPTLRSAWAVQWGGWDEGSGCLELSILEVW